MADYVHLAVLLWRSVQHERATSVQRAAVAVEPHDHGEVQRFDVQGAVGDHVGDEPVGDDSRGAADERDLHASGRNGHRDLQPAVQNGLLQADERDGGAALHRALEDADSEYGADKRASQVVESDGELQDGCGCAGVDVGGEADREEAGVFVSGCLFITEGVLQARKRSDGLNA